MNSPSYFGKVDNQLMTHLVQLRRKLHQHPELAFEEKETAQLVINELEKLNLEYDYAGVGHAVIARIKGTNADLKAVALRAEMDALPGDEATKASYRSIHPGKMHACGHAAHMTMLLGAAHLLVENRPAGPVTLVFQPAEEKGGGARTAITDGALKNITAIFGGHVTHEFITGKIMVRDGPVTAKSDRFTILIKGKSGHGARPHESIDAVVICGFLITALQTLVSREINPFHSAVVTIGKVTAGSAANVIAGEAELEGSIRTTRPEVRSHIHEGMKRMISAVAELHDAKVSIEIIEGYPRVINDKKVTRLVRQLAQQSFGKANVVASEFPSMGSEDFSYYLEKVPGCFVRFGARKPEWEPIPLHSPNFDIDEEVLRVGAVFYSDLVHYVHQHIRAFESEV